MQPGEGVDGAQLELGAEPAVRAQVKEVKRYEGPGVVVVDRRRTEEEMASGGLSR